MAPRVPSMLAQPGGRADPFMPHLCAPPAENERRLIGDRTRAALQAKKAAGAPLGNRTNLSLAGSAGRVSQAQAADEFAKRVLPVLDALRRAGARSEERRV